MPKPSKQYHDDNSGSSSSNSGAGQTFSFPNTEIPASDSVSKLWNSPTAEAPKIKAIGALLSDGGSASASLRVSVSQLNQITSVDTTNDNFVVSGDADYLLSSGETIQVIGSTANDGTYTVSSVSYDSTNNETTISTQESIGDSTVDGRTKSTADSTETLRAEPAISLRADTRYMIELTNLNSTNTVGSGYAEFEPDSA